MASVASAGAVRSLSSCWHRHCATSVWAEQPVAVGRRDLQRLHESRTHLRGNRRGDESDGCRPTGVPVPYPSGEPILNRVDSAW